MVGWMITLWFVTASSVIGYGLSNKAVLTLALPRWSSLAIVGVGAMMLLTMFAAMAYGAATDVPWWDGGPADLGGLGGRRGGD